jgi:propanol-preferring alcohol dehydrogenase
MKAWILEEQSNIEDRPLKMAEVPAPVSGEKEVRVKIQACGIFRTDIHIRMLRKV